MAYPMAAVTYMMVKKKAIDARTLFRSMRRPRKKRTRMGPPIAKPVVEAEEMKPSIGPEMRG